MSEEPAAVAAPSEEAAPAPPPVVEEVAPAAPEPPAEVAPKREEPPRPPRSAKQTARDSAFEKAAAAAKAFEEATRTPGVVDAEGKVHAKEDGTYMEKDEEGKEPGAAEEVAPEGEAKKGAAKCVAPLLPLQL